MNVGEPAPAIGLPGTDGETHTLDPAPTAVVFTCNHCPYALAWHERLLDVARDYEGRVRMLFINPNDADRYPRDSFAAMRERVEADGGWPVPYLRDESQQVARAYGAKTTPDVFLVDAEGVLRYRGAPDSDHADPGQGAAWLRTAIAALLDGRHPDPPETDPVGCSVKWQE